MFFKALVQKKMSMNNHMTEITKVSNSTGIDLECRRLFLLHFAIRPFFKTFEKWDRVKASEWTDYLKKGKMNVGNLLHHLIFCLFWILSIRPNNDFNSTLQSKTYYVTIYNDEAKTKTYAQIFYFRKILNGKKQSERQNEVTPDKISMSDFKRRGFDILSSSAFFCT